MHVSTPEYALCRRLENAASKGSPDACTALTLHICTDTLVHGSKQMAVDCYLM